MEENKQKEALVQCMNKIGKCLSVCKELFDIRVFSLLVDMVGVSVMYYSGGQLCFCLNVSSRLVMEMIIGCVFGHLCTSIPSCCLLGIWTDDQTGPLVTFSPLIKP